MQAVASIDLKADEIGLAEVAGANGWLIRFYPAAELVAPGLATLTLADLDALVAD